MMITAGVEAWTSSIEPAYGLRERWKENFNYD